MPDIPSPPPGTRAPGRRLWTAVLAEYELEEHELALLREIVRTIGVLEDLDAALRRDGVLHESPQGLRAHPAAVEARQQRVALARLQAALRLPSGEDEEGARRPQRRVGVRGVYPIRGGAA